MNAAIVEFCIDVYLNTHQQRARLHVEDHFFYTTSCDTYTVAWWLEYEVISGEIRM